MLLLDSCTLLWLAGDQSSLSARAIEVLRKHAGSLFISAISAFEIAQKHATGKLILPMAPQEWFPRALTHHGVTELPVSSQEAIRATQLPPLHKDPCDRIIVATAQLCGMDVLTPDRLISAYPDIVVHW